LNRTTLARRYAPLAAVVAIQLLIIATVPSTAPSATTVAADSAAGSVASDGSAAADTGQTVDAGTDPAAAGSDGSVVGSSGAPGTGSAATGAGRAGTTAAGPGAAGSPAGGGGVGGAAAPTGDTSHCIDGRQFDPAIDYYAPPCAPKFTGKNPGATYQGVTADTIKIVSYYGSGDPAVNEILKAQKTYVAAPDAKRQLDKFEAFVNSHYELYGRKIQVDQFEGQCKTIPPDITCLRSEMDQIVKDRQPFAVVWNTSLCSACFDELSALKTVNLGGYHFRDQFSAARKPYHWDVQQSGTSLNRAYGQWWCAQMSKKPAKYAGTQNPADNINGRTRILGVISTNDPENQGSVATLKEELGKCGDKVAHEYYYAQDISTAEQQRAAGVSKMRGNGTPGDESTTILCSCDSVAPAFLYEEEQQENYYPENTIAGTGGLDEDAAGQSMSGSLACPTPQNGCEFDRVFGLSSLETQEHVFADRGTRVWKAAGGTGNPPSESISGSWDYYNLLASMIQAAGPTLTPANLERVRQYGLRGGGTTGHIARGFPSGQYAWGQDMRMVYWNKHAKSPYNDVAGSYINIGSTRHNLGQYDATDFNSLGVPFDR